MQTNSIRVEHSINGITKIWMTRASVHNAFDDVLIADLTDALITLSKNVETRVVVLAAEGSSFSAGADLSWMRRMGTASETVNRSDAEKLAVLMRTLNNVPKPTIARVQGSAFGGGVGLVACCDIAIATPECKFGLTEVKLGLVPAVISPYVIDAIGARQARRLFLTGEIFNAPTALRMGLIHELVAHDSLDLEIEKLCGWLLKAGPNAEREAKQLIHRVVRTNELDREQLDLDNARLIARLRVSDEGQEGLAAFLDKRNPNWI